MIDSPGTLFERLLDIMSRLRGDGGCPWDREQTRTSLKAYLIEEAYEVIEAIESGHADALEEELGDLLFQVVFHAQIAREEGAFDMTSLLERLGRKMTSRHPHVFGDATAGTSREVLAQWEAIKMREAEASGRTRSVVDGVPRALPALLRAQRLSSKAARVDFDWPDARAAWDKVEEELREAGEALASDDRNRFGEELGDLLFALVNVARLSALDAEDVLQSANEKFRTRFAAMETDLAAQGASVASAGLGALEVAWQRTNARERASGSRRP